MTIWLRALLAIVVLLVAASAAWADCDHFKWSLARERGWFSGGPEPVEPGAEVAALDRAYELALKPGAVDFVLAPKTPPGPDEFGAALRVKALPKAGLYQITLSREAWVDVVQNGARARTRNVSRQRDCDGVAKSVRFELAAGPAVVQVSGVKATSLVLSLAEAPP